MIASQVPMYSPPSRAQWRAAGKLRMSTLSSRRWFSLAGWPRPSTITGGIESENLLLHLRTSSMTPRPGGSPMATAKRSTLEPIGFQRARYPGGDSLIDLLVRHVGDRTHLLVAADLFADARELADPLDSVDPRAQVPRCLPAARSPRAERSDVEAHLVHRHPPGSPRVTGHVRGHVRCIMETFYMK